MRPKPQEDRPAEGLPLRRAVVWFLAIVGVVAALYGRSVSYPFIGFDDIQLIVDNQAFLADPANALQVFRQHAWTSPSADSDGAGAYYRPLMILSFMWDAQWGGARPTVYHVTNLSDNGPGSLRFGIETMSGPRTIVFDVSGNIELESRLTVSQPYLTIGGQTAPGDGITIANHTFQVVDTHDIIIRYLRVRAGDQDIANNAAETHDSFSIKHSHDVIVDHVSMSWGIDETLSTVWSENVTVQWSIVSESLSDSFHPKGPHGLGSLSYGGSLSLHHNLYAHHDFRMPQVKEMTADVVNNIIYDWSKSYPSSVNCCRSS